MAKKKLGMLQYERLGIRRGVNTNFNYEALTAPPLRSMISEWDMKQIHDICLDPKLNNQLKKKEEWYESILNPRGLVRMGRGTNRVIFKNLENQSIILKVPLSEAGKHDGPSELKNQWLIKPFCTKIFEVSPDGLITVAERGELIRSQEIFYSFGDQLYDFYQMFLGKYIMADVGSEFRKNWVIRPGFGPILCDFPLIYPLDGSKLYCDVKDFMTGIPCGGVIDYDLGYNRLYCKKCGKQYFASQLAKQVESGLIKRRSVSDMKIRINDVNENGVVESYETESVLSSKIFLDDTRTKRENIKTNSSKTGRLVIKINDEEDVVLEKENIRTHEKSQMQQQYKPSMKLKINDEETTKVEEPIQTEEVTPVETINNNHKYGLTTEGIFEIVNQIYNGDVQSYINTEMTIIENKQAELTVLYNEIEQIKQKYTSMVAEYNKLREDNIARTDCLNKFVTEMRDNESSSQEDSTEYEELQKEDAIEETEQEDIQEEVKQDTEESASEEEILLANDVQDEYSNYLESQQNRLVKEYGFAAETVNEVLNQTGFDIEEAEKVLAKKKAAMEKSRAEAKATYKQQSAPFKRNYYAESLESNLDSKYPAKKKKASKKNRNNSMAGY